jgi:hypothetical protein
MSILKVDETKVPLFFLIFFWSVPENRDLSQILFRQKCSKAAIVYMLYRQPIPSGPQSSKKCKNQYLMVFAYAAESN